MAKKTYREIVDGLVADVNALADTEDEALRIFQRLSGECGDQIRKAQEKAQKDVASFITAKAAEFDAHRAAEKAKRQAKGEE